MGRRLASSTGWGGRLSPGPLRAVSYVGLLVDIPIRGVFSTLQYAAGGRTQALRGRTEWIFLPYSPLHTLDSLTLVRGLPATRSN